MDEWRERERKSSIYEASNGERSEWKFEYRDSTSYDGVRGKTHEMAG